MANGISYKRTGNVIVASVAGMVGDFEWPADRDNKDVRTLFEKKVNTRSERTRRSCERRLRVLVGEAYF